MGSAKFHSVPVVYNKRMTYLNHTIANQFSSKTLSIKHYYMYWRWEFLFKSIKKMGH